MLFCLSGMLHTSCARLAAPLPFRPELHRSACAPFECMHVRGQHRITGKVIGMLSPSAVPACWVSGTDTPDLIIFFYFWSLRWSHKSKNEENPLTQTEATLCLDFYLHILTSSSSHLFCLQWCERHIKNTVWKTS